MDAQQVAAVHEHGGVDGRRVLHEADCWQWPCTENEQCIDGGQRHGRIRYSFPNLRLDAFDKEIKDAATMRGPPARGHHNDPEQHRTSIVNGIGIPKADNREIGMKVLKVLVKVKVDVLTGKDA